MVNNLLLVDDEEHLRKTLSRILKLEGFYVEVGGNAEEAKSLFELGDFPLVVSDIKMPGTNGIELLHWIKRNHPETKVILMTGFSEIMEEAEAISIGADDFILKPFRDNVLISKINDCLGLKEGELKLPQEVVDKEYCKIHLDDFVCGSTVPYDIYFRMKSGKYIKLVNKNEEMNVSQLHKFKENKVDYLFFKKEEFKSLVRQNLKITKALKNATKISREKKENFINNTYSSIIQNFHLNGVDDQVLNETKEFLEDSMAIISDDDQMISLLMNLSDHSDFIFNHTMTTTMVAQLIARKIGWATPDTLFKVGLCGMYHNIGLKEIDKRIIEKPRLMLSQDEVSLIESHTTRGMEILNEVGNMPDEVILCAYQHHEDCLGQGFPQGLKKSSISPFSKLIYLSSIFAELFLGNEKKNVQALTPEDCIKKIKEQKQNHYDESMMEGLEKVFK